MNTLDQKIFSRISGYYDELVDLHGNSHRACDYGNPLSQQTKFKVLSEVTNMSGKTVLDVGCGMAEYSVYLAGRFNDVTYTGIDISSKMVAYAKDAHPHTNIQLGNVMADVFESFDVVTANGIFYLLGSRASALMKDIIERMYSISTRAVAFNSLSSWTQDQEEGEFYPDPLATVDFCRQITPWVVLRHDYHSRDFTVYMYKERQT
ncbi:MAG: class I SAM-dependent methyltransferase [Proteobacteria bacterium]|nr:class I SAM-dependent methyltransferase [Pseudomonadota bacterium]